MLFSALYIIQMMTISSSDVLILGILCLVFDTVLHLTCFIISEVIQRRFGV